MIYIFVWENPDNHEIFINDTDGNFEVYSSSVSRLQAENHFVSLHHEYYDGRKICVREGF